MGIWSSIGSIGGGIVGAYFGGPWGAAAGSAAGSGLGGFFDNKNAAGMSRKEADYQNQQQLQFWALNNAYNSPKSVMARLEEAGLNPNLVYQNGGASYQATMPTAAKSSFKYNHDVQPLLFQQYENMQAQEELTKMQQTAAFWQAGLNQNNASIANSNANMTRWREDYARREHEIFKKTGRIPESYLRSDIYNDASGWLRTLFTNFMDE